MIPSTLLLMASELTEKEFLSNGLIGNLDNGFKLVNKNITNRETGELQRMSLAKPSIHWMTLSTLLLMVLELIEKESQFNGQTGNQVSGFTQELNQEKNH
jgi:hypothetical protein